MSFSECFTDFLFCYFLFTIPFQSIYSHLWCLMLNLLYEYTTMIKLSELFNSKFLAICVVSYNFG